jgi:hypothetical protein
VITSGAHDPTKLNMNSVLFDIDMPAARPAWQREGGWRWRRLS